MQQAKRERWIRLGGYAFIVAVASLSATWVGLAGTWVADDWHMVGNYLYEDWTELGAVFTRNAAHYLFGGDKAGPYRPVTMFTLLASHLITPQPGLHHAVGWLLHAATSLLLFGVLRSQPSGDTGSAESVTHQDIVAAGLASIFFLHPVHVESYVWINGRSDLLAGFWLVALAFTLNRLPRSASPRFTSMLLLALLSFAGAGSKLPFAIAAVAVWQGWSSLTVSTAKWRAGAAIGAGIAVHLALRAVFAPFRGQLGASENVYIDPAVWSFVPRLAGKGMDALVAFRSEAMQSLTWVLFGPWSVPEVFGLVMAVLLLAVLLYRRDWSGAVYWVGALATLAPVVIVSGTIWFGFDRYLYMPSILALLALYPYALRAISFSPGFRIALCTIGIGALACGAFQTHHASEAYASQEAYDRALLRDHFDDPSVHYYLARTAYRRSDGRRMRKHLSLIPPPPWPRPLIVPMYELAMRARDFDTASEAVDALVASSRPGRPCALAQAQLDAWAEKARGRPISAHLDEARASLPCSQSGGAPGR